jgi:hypothetical protein
MKKSITRASQGLLAHDILIETGFIFAIYTRSIDLVLSPLTQSLNAAYVSTSLSGTSLKLAKMIISNPVWEEVWKLVVEHGYTGYFNNGR